MRALSLIGLVLALLVVAGLVKRQLSEVAPRSAEPETPTAVRTPAQAQQVQQELQQQMRDALDAAAKARALPDN